jgi:hypothetical protein
MKIILKKKKLLKSKLFLNVLKDLNSYVVVVIVELKLKGVK